jgi:hypothetical protein
MLYCLNLFNYLGYSSFCSLTAASLGGATGGGDFMCLPLYSLLKALGNPTVNFFRKKDCFLMLNDG